MTQPSDTGGSPARERMAVQLNDDDTRIVKFIREQSGVSSDSDLLRAALRAHLREIERATGKACPPAVVVSPSSEG